MLTLTRSFSRINPTFSRIRHFCSTVDICQGKKKDYKKKYWEENKDILSQKHKEYREENKEIISQKKKKYWEENKRILSQKNKEYREENKEIISQKKKKYRERNKEIISQKKGKYWEENKEILSQKYKRYWEENKDLLSQKRKKENYDLSRKPVKSWKTQQDVRKNLDAIAQTLLIQSPNDWYRISNQQLQKGGGGGIIKTFGSLFAALKIGYPEQEWNETDFSIRNKKSAQRWLLVQLQQLLPDGTEILEDFQHPQLLWSSSSFSMELDIWIPKYKLALEYQGELHYSDNYFITGPYASMAMYQSRDREKTLACEKAGITLISIPYWWDGDQESLKATLHLFRPDLFGNSTALPIPEKEPKLQSLKALKVSSLMHGVDWDLESQDPTGWIMSEKLDGIRALWNGSLLITRKGHVINVPASFISSLPTNIHLDGELWSGYNDLSGIMSIFLRTSVRQTSDPDLWDSVHFRIFDAPNHEGNYQQRHAFAESVISECGQHISMIPIQICTGVDHLMSALEEVKARDGEGIMLYHPAAPYTSGRTDVVQKAKLYQESIVRYLSKSSKSFTFLCLQNDGISCVIKSPAIDYYNPSPVGTQLRVKHLGVYQKSKKLKSALLIGRIPRDPTVKEKPAQEILDSTYFSESTTPTLIVFDIETNDHPDNNPFMIELGWCLFDEEGNILKGYPTSHLIQPEEFGPTYVNPATKEEFHGISFEHLKAEGRPFAQVFELFSIDLEKVMTNESGRIGSYSLEFDQKMLLKSAELLPSTTNIEMTQALFKEKGIDVMKEVTKFEKGRTRLDVTFQKLSKLPIATKLQLLQQSHHTGTDSLIAGLVLFELKKAREPRAEEFVEIC